MKRTVHFVSLGCPKNLVDSEVMLGLLQGDGYEVVDSPEHAEVIVVNTCSFIEPAKEESVHAILDAASYKSADRGRCQKLVVAGCLSQRYPKELASDLPEVDHFLGTGEYAKIADILHSNDRIAVGIPRYLADHTMPRVVTSGPSAYLRISEGCSNPCTFCIIPKLRGRHRSRSVASLVAEAERLAAGGVVELNLIAQDLTDYGSDFRGDDAGRGLVELLDALERVDGIRWIRLLYAYPRPMPDAFFEKLAAGGKVLPYLDMPVQHASDPVLRAMKRHHDRAFTFGMLADLRRRVPGITLRTSLIVGFPGETDDDFDDLRAFVDEVRFERLGVFPYSHEEGTVAFDRTDLVSKRGIESRRRALMAQQKKISRAANKRLVGKVVDALVEGMSDETDLLLQARMASQGPGGIDGFAYVNDGFARPGTIVKLEITQAGDYDVVGRIVDVVAEPRIVSAPKRTAASLPVLG
jgi:ribosomal protein S12 methylthiotransferase